MKNELITKIYYCENSDLLDIAIAEINKPKHTVGCAIEYVEMNYSKITVECYPHQIALVEAILAPYV